MATAEARRTADLSDAHAQAAASETAFKEALADMQRACVGARRHAVNVSCVDAPHLVVLPRRTLETCDE